MSGKGSLWSELSASARNELIPIISTAILVEAGEATADALVRLAHFTPFAQKVEETAVDDVTGMLLLLNLAVVVWFAYRTLKEAIRETRPVTLDAKLVGLSTAFLTSADLIAYGVKTHHPDRTVYALLVFLFVFIVPFFLIKRSPRANAAPKGENDVGLYALGTMALVVNAVLPAIAGIISATLFEIALNDLGGRDHSFVVAVLGQSARSEYWGVSPGVYGIAWAPLLLSAYQWIEPDKPSIDIGLDWIGVSILALASLSVFSLMAIVLVDDSSLLLVPDPIAVARATLMESKVVLALVIAACFTGAFLLTRVIIASAWPPSRDWLASLAVFAFGGALVGGTICLIRLRDTHASPSSVALILLHAAGFAITYAAGRFTLMILRREFSSLIRR